MRSQFSLNHWCANLCVTPSLYYNFVSGYLSPPLRSILQKGFTTILMEVVVASLSFRSVALENQIGDVYMTPAHHYARGNEAWYIL